MRVKEIHSLFLPLFFSRSFGQLTSSQARLFLKGQLCVLFLLRLCRSLAARYAVKLFSKDYTQRCHLDYYTFACYRTEKCVLNFNE